MSSPAIDKPQHRIALWDSLLTAEMNVNYWNALCDRSFKLDRWLKFFIALSSSGSAIAAFTIWQRYPFVWKWIVLSSGIAAVVHQYLCDSEMLQQISATLANWKEVLVDYELLWEFDQNLIEHESSKTYQSTKHREAKIDDTKLPKRKRLIEKAYVAVLERRGLNGRTETTLTNSE